MNAEPRPLQLKRQRMGSSLEFFVEPLVGLAESSRGNSSRAVHFRGSECSQIRLGRNEKWPGVNPATFACILVRNG